MVLIGLCALSPWHFLSRGSDLTVRARCHSVVFCKTMRHAIDDDDIAATVKAGAKHAHHRVRHTPTVCLLPAIRVGRRCLHLAVFHAVAAPVVLVD